MTTKCTVFPVDFRLRISKRKNADGNLAQVEKISLGITKVE